MFDEGFLIRWFFVYVFVVVLGLGIEYFVWFIFGYFYDIKVCFGLESYVCYVDKVRFEVYVYFLYVKEWFCYVV